MALQAVEHLDQEDWASAHALSMQRFGKLGLFQIFAELEHPATIDNQGSEHDAEQLTFLKSPAT